MRLLRNSERNTFQAPGSQALVSILAGAGKEHGDLKNHTLAVVRIPAGESLGRHFHKYREESYLVISGRGIITIEEQDVEVNPGDLVSVSPGERHALKASTTEALEYIVVTAPAWTVEDIHA
jgi:mannose-6-phosphate isomerase-like protein (cupin superfamily)